jgi:hypothetical protein
MGGDDSILSPSKHGRSSSGRIFQASSTRGADNIEISLPDLKSQRDIESSELSVGDISPIKLVYTSSTSFHEAGNVPREDAFMNQTKYAFPPSMLPVDIQRDASVVPTDWREDIDTFNPQGKKSNPFFVLRSSRKAFENVKYLLPCLSSSTGVCPVNMSDYGSIRQYKEKPVS